MIKLETPLTIEKVESLRAGDQVLLSVLFIQDVMRRISVL